MILMKSFLTGVLCDYMIYTWMIYQTYIRVFKWKGWRSRKWCLKMMIQSHLHVGFFTIFFIKLASLKRFYFYMKLLQSSSIFKQKTIMKCLVIKIFAWNVLQLPIQKKKKKIITIATLGIVTTDKHELTFLIFCFHEMQYIPAEIWLFVAIGAVI